MPRVLNPDVIARDVANAFCRQYVSSLEPGKLESACEYRKASVLYAGAYDAAYDYIMQENHLPDEEGHLISVPNSMSDNKMPGF